MQLIPSLLLNSVTSIPVKISIIRTARVTKLIWESGKLQDLTIPSKELTSEINDSPPKYIK